MIRVLYFGQIAEALGKSEEHIDPGVLDRSVRHYFQAKYPVLLALPYRIAIDQELREEMLDQEQIQEIALLPPFAGG